MRQLSKIARLERDKGMKGDGFEWAVHEAIVGAEPSVTELVARAMGRMSRKYKDMQEPQSLLFGYERAKYLGFLDAVVEDAGDSAVLLPDGQGRPFGFGPWVTVAAQGVRAEPILAERIKKVWKTDLFFSDEDGFRYTAATIKSNWKQLESGPGLRIGVVPEAKDLRAGVRFQDGLWLAVLPDPDGFMGMFNDAYSAVAAAVCTLGRHSRPAYFLKPTAKAQRLQRQLEKYPTAKVVEIEHALNEAAQQHLISVDHKLLSVRAPGWLHMNETRTPIIAPRPRFEPLD
ncbi:hypothetical protein [Streptomyces niveus]|uniref:Uncharacterized protein n=1 Tax=Streptomyces niveus TaxID=193462 RepID=A0A1U9QU34_STRNV|nr:hypothetical protein [Streptomyces niveus]AQU67730.1 hypothetical protein BBN63_17270 [Streptomyces niveus]